MSDWASIAAAVAEADRWEPDAARLELAPAIAARGHAVASNAATNVVGPYNVSHGNRFANPSRFRLVITALLLAGAALLVAAATVMTAGTADRFCEPFEGSSTYGKAGWTALPPGLTCTFTAEVHGFDEVRGPYPRVWTWLAVLVFGGALLVALRRSSRATGSPTAARVCRIWSKR